MKNFTQAIGAIDDQATRDAMLALYEENQRLNRKLTELQDSVLSIQGTQDDRAEYSVSQDEDVASIVRERMRRTAMLEMEQSNLIDEDVQQDIRRYISENEGVLTLLNEIFQCLLDTRVNFEPLIKGMSLDDTLAALKVEITRNATKVEIVS